MAFVHLPAPRRLERRLAPERLPISDARKLRNVDVQEEPGTVRRSRGYTRADFETGLANIVHSAWTFRRRDGVKILVWATTAGTWTAQVDPGAANAEGDY